MFVYSSEGNVLSIEYSDFNSLHEYYLCMYKYQYGINIPLYSKNFDTISHIKNILSIYNIHEK